MLSVDNHKDEETLGYSLIRLVGKAKGNTVTIRHQPGHKKTQWKVLDDHYKALILLNEGMNVLTISDSNTTLQYRFTYDAKLINVTSNYDNLNSIPRVRPVIYVPLNHDGSFNNLPYEPNDLEALVKKNQIAALLMQTFCAEALEANKTFPLEMESNNTNLPRVTVFKSNKWTREALREEGKKANDEGFFWYDQVIREMQERDDYNDALTYLCVLNGSYYYPEENKTSVATALGGGKLALWTDVNMYSYPMSVEEIESCWMDDRKVDKTVVRDDSCGRGTYWANFATGIGAHMHELGHCLGCDHTPGGIMQRGFDNFNRFFLIEEPGNNKGIYSKDQQAGAYWEQRSIETILKHKIFELVGECVIPKGGSTKCNPNKEYHKCVDDGTLQCCHYWVCGDDYITSSSFENPRGLVWIERHGKTPFATFHEVSRSATEIIISDSSRGMLLKFTKDQCTWTTDRKQWYLLRSGRAFYPGKQEDLKILKVHNCELAQ
ncbi:hypothetical protein ABK040_006064 [Willaertia magna]